MAVSFTNLSGTRENLDKTIRYRLQANWTPANTSSITPVFESDTESSDNLARQDDSYLNNIRINLFSRERIKDAEMDFNGDDKHTWKFKLLIEVQAETLSLLTLFEDEINRILWTLSPNSGTRLLKSDGANSEAEFFEDSEISFNRIEPESKDDYTPISQGELVIFYSKIRT